jgi:hypothetical protein
MSGTVSTLQDFPWEESVQAVKDSPSFDSYPAFAEHVFHTLPQNSPQTRRPYVQLIGHCFFPERRLPGFPHRTADDLQPDELQPCLSLATECRQRVLDQLAVMLPEEFGGVRVKEE